MTGPTEAELAEIRAAARRREHPETLTDRLRQLREENERLRSQLAYLRRAQLLQPETKQRPDMARHVETLPGFEPAPAWHVPLPPLLEAWRVLVRTQPVRIDDPYADLWRAFRKEPEL